MLEPSSQVVGCAMSDDHQNDADLTPAACSQSTVDAIKAELKAVTGRLEAVEAQPLPAPVDTAAAAVVVGLENRPNAYGER